MKTARRLTIVATCVVVAGLTGAFAFLRWDQASWLATVVAALAAVAAIGVAVWAGLQGPSSRTTTLEAKGTGDAVVRDGGNANTGVMAPADDAAALKQDIRAIDTGRADVTRHGRANTGIDLTPEDRDKP